MRFSQLASLAGAAALAATALLAAPAGAAPAQPAGPGTHAGLTWGKMADGPDGTVQVGTGNSGNPYQGDTPASAVLPVLCLNVDGSPVPDGITPGFYAGWAQGTVAASRPVRGSRLNSLTAANSVCQAQFGAGWRIAEFHDGHFGPDLASTGGWSFWAYGDLPAGTRMWTYINDQRANPWD
ncbi:flagellar hook-length control protein [Streptomyces orinoci]|uniref:Flagellar hook-length control protein n=1 Tax=Streptomyces orinoci TaxID=67339 RepID=A0ABV3JZ97_STRON|nr:flagellar hook-length control protein [Streptomyces orinoci]